MFRTLIILILCIFGLYWLYGYFFEGGVQVNTAPVRVGVDFDTYLSGALERNNSDSQRYSVTFSAEEFGGKGNSNSLDTFRLNLSEAAMSGRSIEEIFDLQGGVSEFGNSSLGEGNGKNLIVSTGTMRIQVPSGKGNFGTPPIKGEGITTDDECHGIIFDPCIVIGNFPPASGGMDMGEWRVNG